MKKKVMTFCFILFLNTWALSQTPVSIIPQPAKMQLSEGYFEINAKTVFQVDEQTQNLLINRDEQLQNPGYQMMQVLAEAIGEFPSMEDGQVTQTNCINLFINPALQELGTEGYKLQVTQEKVTIEAPDITGVRYGIQTFRQLLPVTILGTSLVHDHSLRIPCVEIEDCPRFPWRGFMLDVSRTFYSMDVLKKYIDAMALYKLNVFHLHLTDDAGWRVEIKKYPKLTSVGSQFAEKYHEPPCRSGFYTQKELKQLVAYAKERNITIVPEIDMPGHFWAALVAYPEFSLSGNPQPAEVMPHFDLIRTFGGLGTDTLDPTREEVYQFVDDIFTEIVEIFPSPYIHIGGDEVRFDVWQNNPRINEFMKENHIKNVQALQSYFTSRVNDILRSKGRTLVGWDEILDGGLPEGAAVMAWRAPRMVKAATAAGAVTVAVTGNSLYLDYCQDEPSPDINCTSVTTIQTFYSYNPCDGLTEEEQERLLGIQAAMWTHVARDVRDVDIQIFPRLIAAAESGWTPLESKDFDRFSKHLKEQHFSYLDTLGIAYYVVQTYPKISPQ